MIYSGLIASPRYAEILHRFAPHKCLQEHLRGPRKIALEFRPKATGEPIDLPMNTGKLEWPALSSQTLSNHLLGLER